MAESARQKQERLAREKRLAAKKKKASPKPKAKPRFKSKAAYKEVKEWNVSQQKKKKVVKKKTVRLSSKVPAKHLAALRQVSEAAKKKKVKAKQPYYANTKEYKAKIAASRKAKPKPKKVVRKKRVILGSKVPAKHIAALRKQDRPGSKQAAIKDLKSKLKPKVKVSKIIPGTLHFDSRKKTTKVKTKPPVKKSDIPGMRTPPTLKTDKERKVSATLLRSGKRDPKTGEMVYTETALGKKVRLKRESDKLKKKQADYAKKHKKVTAPKKVSKVTTKPVTKLVTKPKVTAKAKVTTAKATAAKVTTKKKAAAPKKPAKKWKGYLGKYIGVDFVQKARRKKLGIKPKEEAGYVGYKAKKAVKTKGGTYIKYEKGSVLAKSFKSAFKKSCTGDAKGFTWQGRKYSCKKA